MAEPWKHAFIDANGIRIHYVTAGQGPPVVLLHGFPEFWYAWRHQIPVLAERFRVIVPDLRGYGETERPQSVADYESRHLVGDLVGLIKALGYEKAHIVGHDWGGSIAWHTALEQPQIVDRLVVLNCPHPRIFAKALRSNFRQLMKSWYLFFFQIPYLPEFILRRDSKGFLKRILRGMTFRKEAFSDADLERYYQALEKPGAYTAALNYYRAAFRNRSKAQSVARRSIGSPTLVIWGEDDAALGRELTYGMEPLFTGPFRLQYIPHCSHWVNEEQPELVNSLLMKFLTEDAAR